MKQIILFLLLTSMATAAEPAKPVNAQAVAQLRAEWLLARPHYRWHPPYYSVGNVWRYARFEGVGWGRAGAVQQRMGTCTPRYRMRLVGDGFASNGRLSVRVRLWR